MVKLQSGNKRPAVYLMLNIRYLGSRPDNDCRTAPVPPRTGKRNVLLGPQPQSSRPSSTFRPTRCASGTETRSAIHPASDSEGGYAHVFSLYGRMKRRAMPAPKVRVMKSSKSANGLSLRERPASSRPLRHSSRSAQRTRIDLYLDFCQDGQESSLTP